MPTKQSQAGAQSPHVDLAASGDALVLTLDRAPVNAMSLELLESLVTQLEAVAAAPPLALVVTGAGSCFSAGVDLKAVSGYGEDEQRRMVTALNDMVLCAYALPCPVVVAVTGHAIAGGLVLALCGDHRVASAEGRYGLTEVKVGVPYPVAALGVVRCELHAQAARRLVLAAGLHSAEHCAQLGVFDDVVAPADVLPRALEVASQLSAMPAATYSQTKRSLRDQALSAMRVAAAADPLLQGWLSPKPSQS